MYCECEVCSVSLRVAQLNAFFVLFRRRQLKFQLNFVFFRKFRLIIKFPQGNFLENDFWTPLPPTIRLLSILYMALICNTQIMWPQRQAPQPSTSTFDPKKTNKHQFFFIRHLYVLIKYLNKTKYFYRKNIIFNFSKPDKQRTLNI